MDIENWTRKLGSFLKPFISIEQKSGRDQCTTFLKNKKYNSRPVTRTISSKQAPKTTESTNKYQSDDRFHVFTFVHPYVYPELNHRS